MKYESVIGLEVHVELKTKTKIFCGCSTEFGAEPNTHVCPVCLGLPGVLPVLNKEVLHYAVKAGLALHCDILPFSKFRPQELLLSGFAEELPDVPVRPADLQRAVTSTSTSTANSAAST